MELKPDQQVWLSYIKFELRYNEIERARGIFENFVICHPKVGAWIRYAKFEMKNGEVGSARKCYERAVEMLADDEEAETLFVHFAEFEERCKETDRARSIYKFALDHIPKGRAEDLYKKFVAFEKQYGNREGIEDAIVGKKRFQYEDEVRKNHQHYDCWFDYVRLEESVGNKERIREIYERAIANVPPAEEKRYWRRYIFLWMNYVLYEEMDAGDVERTRDVFSFSATNTINGFTMELIHRDSPNSPLYNPSLTHAQRIHNSFRRSSDRINSFIYRLNNNDFPTVDLYTDGGAYLMNLSIGSPPVQYLAIADTGSNVMWTQCQPCEKCYPQTSPIFDPKASSSYTQLGCASPSCASIGRCENNVCTYAVNYFDKSSTKGHLASETFQIGPVTVPNLVFGCGTNNLANAAMQGNVSGLIGLDRGPDSLITQLGSSINGKFSYCLVPIRDLEDKSSSKMKFGTDATVTGDGVIQTPLVFKNPNVSHYHITLLGISVGSERFDISTPVTSGNLIVDSGTTHTFIPADLYNKVAESLKRQSKQPIGEDTSKLFPLCFNTKDDILDPGLTLNFDGGDMILASYNYFTRLTEELTCLSIFPNDSITILGNLAQMNLLVGYDLQANILSIKGSDCTM